MVPRAFAPGLRPAKRPTRSSQYRDRRVFYGVNMKETELGTIDSHIKKDGFEAAKAVLPDFQWLEIRQRWPEVNVMKRFAALVLRRAQLTKDVNILMSTEFLEIFLDNRDELRIYANGEVKMEPTDKIICHNNLMKG